MSKSLLHEAGVGDIIRPFQLESSSLRGRIVRFDNVVDEILSKHDYPDIVSQLVGEMLVLSALLSSMLKYEGIFTLQTQGDGPIKMMVSDITTGGDLRGCAAFDEARVIEAKEQLAVFAKENVGESNDNQLAQLLGKGYIAFTVDQGEFAERYQGIVELKGASLVDCVQHYFSQSEQIDTGVKLAVGKRNGKWRASGIMVQRVPEDGGLENAQHGELLKGEAAQLGHLDEDDWRRAMILLHSCTDDELLDANLPGYELLLRLFHEEGVRVYEPTKLRAQCRCSVEKIENILAMMSDEDLEEMVVDGNISMQCEFCSHDYVMSKAEALKVVSEIRSNSGAEA